MGSVPHIPQHVRQINAKESCDSVLRYTSAMMKRSQSSAPPAVSQSVMYVTLPSNVEMGFDVFQTCRFHENYRAAKDSDSLHRPVRFADELEGKNISYH